VTRDQARAAAAGAGQARRRGGPGFEGSVKSTVTRDESLRHRLAGRRSLRDSDQVRDSESRAEMPVSLLRLSASASQ
jgi:hypothetical protein